MIIGGVDYSVSRTIKKICSCENINFLLKNVIVCQLLQVEEGDLGVMMFAPFDFFLPIKMSVVVWFGLWGEEEVDVWWADGMYYFSDRILGSYYLHAPVA